MKNMRRAIRRHHRNRVLAHTVQLMVIRGFPEEHRRQRALRIFNNRQACACWMCGLRTEVWGPRTRDLRQRIVAAYEITLSELDSEDGTEEARL